ncbi:hypothetical protein DL98DRAFT_295627 [Cadophora sp. DSE1049]|nr:hypothetical protein DL98DRAFT_295627 [Cadophora sp. DSE1049]
MSERFDSGWALQMILLLEGRAFLDTGAGFNCHLRCWVEIDLPVCFEFMKYEYACSFPPQVCAGGVFSEIPTAHVFGVCSFSIMRGIHYAQAPMFNMLSL